MRAVVPLFIAAILASVPAFAQQAPQAPQERPGPTPAPAPPGAAPGAAQAAPSNKELADLLRAQTAAIKSLSGKLDTLETRIRALEDAPR